MSIILRDEDAEEYTLNMVGSADILQRFRLRWKRLPALTKAEYPAEPIIEEDIGTSSIRGYRYSEGTLETFASFLHQCSDIIAHSLGFECWLRYHVDTPEWRLCEEHGVTDSCLEIIETIHYKMNKFGISSEEYGVLFICRNKPDKDTCGIERIAKLQSINKKTLCNKFHFNNNDPDNTFWIYSPEGLEYGDFSYTNNIYKKHKMKTAPRAIFL